MITVEDLIPKWVISETQCSTAWTRNRNKNAFGPLCARVVSSFTLTVVLGIKNLHDSREMRRELSASHLSSENSRLYPQATTALSARERILLTHYPATVELLLLLSYRCRPPTSERPLESSSAGATSGATSGASYTPITR